MNSLRLVLSGARGVVQRSYPLFWLLVAWCVAILIVPERQSLTNIYIVLLLIPFLLYARAAGVKELASSPIVRLAAVLLIAMYASMLWNDPHEGRLLAKFAYYGFLNFSFLVLVTYLIQEDRNREPQLFLSLGCAALAIGIISVIGRCCTAGALDPRFHFGHWSNVNTGATLLGLILVGVLATALDERERTRKAILVAVSIALASLLVATASRSPILAVLCSMATIAAVSRSARFLLAVLFGSLLVVLAAVLFGIIDLQWWIGRADGQRLAVWGYFAELALKRPLSGYGIQNEWVYKFGSVDSPHNMLVSSFFYAGLVGAAAFLALILTALRRAVRSLMKAGHACPLALVVYLAIHGMFESIVPLHRASWIWVYFWLPIALAAAAVFRRTDLSRGPLPQATRAPAP